MGLCEAAGDEEEEDVAALRTPPHPRLQGAPALLLHSHSSPNLARPRLGSVARGRAVRCLPGGLRGPFESNGAEYLHTCPGGSLQPPASNSHPLGRRPLSGATGRKSQGCCTGTRAQGARDLPHGPAGFLPGPGVAGNIPRVSSAAPGGRPFQQRVSHVWASTARLP